MNKHDLSCPLLPLHTNTYERNRTTGILTLRWQYGVGHRSQWRSYGGWRQQEVKGGGKWRIATGRANTVGRLQSQRGNLLAAGLVKVASSNRRCPAPIKKDRELRQMPKLHSVLRGQVHCASHTRPLTLRWLSSTGHLRRVSC